MKQPFVLAAGRVWDDAKNIRALCAIAPVIAWPVYIAGDVRDPAGRGDVEIAASTPVRFLGRLDPSALGQWFDRAAIYALPARYEPFGLSILEAASAGCALVLGDITSLRENWSGAALFVPPDDRAALAAAIRRLIDHDDERCALATRAHERARRFGIDKTADAYARVYCEASHESRLRSSNWRRPAAAEDSA
jgi:glycosyltransferase involved in cell wall biosynthesis